MRGTEFVLSKEATKALVLPSHQSARLRLTKDGAPSLLISHRAKEGVLPGGEKFGILTRHKDGTSSFSFPIEIDQITAHANGFSTAPANYHWTACLPPTAEKPAEISLREIILPDPVAKTRGRKAPETTLKAGTKPATAPSIKDAVAAAEATTVIPDTKADPVEVPNTDVAPAAESGE